MDPMAAFFDYSPDLLAIITADGDIVRTNPAWESLLGYRREDLAGLTLFDLLHPDDVKVTAAALKSLNGDGTARSFSNRHRHRDGSWRHLSWRANAEPSGYVFASAHDVTGDLALRRELASEEAIHKALFDYIRQGVVYQSPGGQVESANPAALEMLGLSLEELQGRTSVDPRWRSVHPDLSDFPSEQHPAMEVLRTGEPVRDVDMGVFDPTTGKYRWLRVDAHPIQRDGQTWSVATFTDVTALREAVATSSELRQAIDKHVILSMTDAHGIITDVNDKFCISSGYSREELIGNTHGVVNSGEHDEEFFHELWETITRGDIWQGEIINRSKNGNKYWVLSTIVPLRDFTGEIRQYISIRTDISAQKRAELEAAAASLVDDLTKLPNRRHFDAELAKQLAHAGNTGLPLAAIMFDIDFFKRFNDTYGHRSGDAALASVAAVLSAGLRSGDFLARWGGEEFAALLPATDLQAAQRVANRLREAVSRLEMDVPTRDRLTVSAGVAVSSAVAPRTRDDLIEAADRELYRAKSSGRNQVSVTD